MSKVTVSKRQSSLAAIINGTMAIDTAAPVVAIALLQQAQAIGTRHAKLKASPAVADRGGLLRSALFDVWSGDVLALLDSGDISLAYPDAGGKMVHGAEVNTRMVKTVVDSVTVYTPTISFGDTRKGYISKLVKIYAEYGIDGLAECANSYDVENLSRKATASTQSPQSKRNASVRASIAGMMKGRNIPAGNLIKMRQELEAIVLKYTKEAA